MMTCGKCIWFLRLEHSQSLNMCSTIDVAILMLMTYVGISLNKKWNGRCCTLKFFARVRNSLNTQQTRRHDLLQGNRDSAGREREMVETEVVSRSIRECFGLVCENFE